MGEGDAEIDGQPRTVARAKAVDRQVHTDLADTAERREDQFLRGAGHDQLRRAEDFAGGDGAGLRLLDQQPAGLVERVGNGGAVALSAERTRMASPSPAARASQPARMPAKPAPPSPLGQPALHRRRQRGHSAFGVNGTGLVKKSVAGEGRSWRMAAQSTPKPIDHANTGSLSPSIRMPASLSAASSSRSFGHL